MRSSVKAALLSGLILPGVGQLWLRRWIWGTVLLLATLAALTAVTARVAEQAYRILERQEAANGSVDLLAVARTAQERSSADPVVQTCWLVLVGAWTVGVIQAYLAGRQRDQERRGKDQALKTRKD